MFSHKLLLTCCGNEPYYVQKEKHTGNTGNHAEQTRKEDYMENESIRLNEYIQEDVKKLRDIAFPVSSVLIHRLLVRSYPCAKLHPNPDDEFCDPAIGPSNRIIKKYAEKLRRADTDSLLDPIQIVRIYPKGYMILNGHHRWAAFLLSGAKKIKVKLVNPTTEPEIRKMLKKVKNDRRVTIDLDEVVFGEPGDFPLEEPCTTLQKRFSDIRIRKGIPMLFNYLENHGYDVWLYSGKYYSRKFLIQYFLHYKVLVKFFVTGLRRKSNLFSIIEEKYKGTLHIDARSVLYVDKATKEFQDYDLDLDNGKEWAQAVIDTLNKMEGNHV